MSELLKWVLEKGPVAAIGVSLLALVSMLGVEFYRHNGASFEFFGFQFGSVPPTNFPKGTILAVRGECPEPQWKSDPDAAGRFLVGANPLGVEGRPKFPLGVTVGAATATLLEANLPPHSHVGNTKAGEVFNRQDWRIVFNVGNSWYANHATGFNGNLGFANPKNSGDAPGMSHYHPFETTGSPGLTSKPLDILPPSLPVSFCVLTQ